MAKKKEVVNRKIDHQMLERLVWIHNKIKEGRYPNVSFFVKKLECSPSTINRDIDFLRCRFNAPIEYDSSKRGYYYSETYVMPLAGVSVQNLIAISSAKILLANYKGTPIYDELYNTIDLLTGSVQNISGNFLERIAVPPTPPIILDEKIWDAIYEAMQTNSIIEFEYIGNANSKTKRTVRPYQILIDEGMCFLFGFCELRNAERLFCLTRMQNVIITNNHFTLPINFEFSSRCGGGNFGPCIETEVKKYTIQFYGYARLYVKDRIWADDQKIVDYDEGITEITFSSAQNYRVLKWVLSQGANAKPISPPEFVEEWEEQIHLMNELVGK